MARKPMNYWAGSAQELARYYPPEDANSAQGYIRISRGNKIFLMHRWIWGELMGPIPDRWEIDHINGIRTDNRLENLRCIPQAAQMRNREKRIDNKSSVQGVSLWSTTRRGNQKVSMWRASAINGQGKQIIKTFSIAKYGNEQAFAMACAARKQMEKEFNYHPNHGREKVTV